LPAAANLATAPRGVALDLAAGVGVDLGVEHQDVDVRAGGQDVVEAAEADVVGPAVAADDPDALADQGVGDGEQVAGFGGSRLPGERFRAARRRARAGRRFPLRSGLRRVEDGVGQLVADLGREARRAARGVIALLVEGEADAEAELGVVLEERVGPGRAAASAFVGVGRGGQVAAVDRGAAGGVGDEQPVAEELGEQLEVGRLAAAGAGAGELEERLQELESLTWCARAWSRVDSGQGEEEVPVARSGRGAAAAPC
jgi:hypothetical protein